MSNDPLGRFLAALEVLRAHPWYDVTAEGVETIANVLRAEGKPMAYYIGKSSDPPESVRQMILGRTATHGNVTAPAALFRVEMDEGGAERVYLAPRGRAWKRRLEARMLER